MIPTSTNIESDKGDQRDSHATTPFIVDLMFGVMNVGRMMPDGEEIVREDTEGGKKGGGEDWMVVTIKLSVRLSEFMLETGGKAEAGKRFGSISDYRHQHPERSSDSLNILIN